MNFERTAVSRLRLLPMNTKPLPLLSKSDLLPRIEALLAEPTHQDNPLHEALALLFKHSESQQRQLEKLIKISDCNQNSLHEITNALRDLSLHDPLTGIGNRRFLMEKLNGETERANRNGNFYSLGILDIDLFKSINDRFGHDTGDDVLCRITRTIQDTLREYDHCGRWGGEEFLIILPETALDFARQVAERILESIENLHFDAFDIHVTASVGLTTHQPDETFSETISRADSALLNAKSLGRNRVEIA